MSGDREKIFARIREALSVAAPYHHEKPAPGVAVSHPPAPFRAWLPPVGETLESRIELFARQSEVLRTEFVQCADAAAAAAHLAGLAETNGWKKLALHRGQLIDPITAHLPSSLEQVHV